MSWRDALGLVGRSVVRRPGRAALTIAAVALATALLTALLSIARTAQTRVLGELSKGGPLAGISVAAAAPDPADVDSDNPRPGPARALDRDAVRRVAAIPDVRSVVPIVDARVLVIVPSAVNGSLVETLVGTDLRRSSQLPLTLLSGRLPDPGSATEIAVTPAHLARVGIPKSRAARVVGTELELGAARLFGHDASARYRGRWTRALIVGVVAQEASSGELLAPIEQSRAARAWTAAGDDRGAREGLDPSPYSGLFVVARGLDRVASVRAAITDIGYSTSAPENLVATVQRYLHVVESVLSGIGAIALVIASLGISNALLAAVRERRREIGVLKAIGARDRDVLRVFLIEAGVLGLAGGVVGTALGFVVARTVAAVVNGYLTSQGLGGAHLTVPAPLVGGGIAGATVLAIAAGAVPAWRAAHLPAREAVDA